MTEMKYPELFEPFKIGNLTIRNRIVMAPMDPKHDTPDHPYSDKTIAYYARRAEGGAGLIVTGCLCAPYNVEGGIAVTSEFKAEDEIRRQLPKLVHAVHAHGAKLFTQTWLNFGRICFPVSVNKRVAASEGPNLWAPELTNRALTTKEVEKMIASNVYVAKVCAECGVDGISVVGPYGGYLADQFGTELFNHREDKYGGDLDGRARATVEMIHGIKEACGEDFPVVVRFSTRHHIEGVHKGQIPGQAYREAGRDVPESIELARRYIAAGANGFLTANGCYDALYWQYSPVYLPEGEWIEDVAPLTKAVDVPVICSGRILIPEIAEKAIKEGKITAACLGRPLLADPDWAKKAKEGKAEDIRPCIGCNNGCIGRVMNAQPVACAVNTHVFKESEPEIVQADKKKKIIIIGAGVGGMEAARVAKLRGHDVEIYDKSDKTGGIFNVAAAPSFKHGDERLLNWYDRQMKKLSIPVHLNQQMTADSIRKLHADEVIIATGSSPKRPPIPGIDKMHTVYAADVLSGKKKVSGNIAILGAGLIGCETAIYTTEDQNNHVTLIDIVRWIMTGGIEQPPTVNLEYMERILGAKENLDMRMRTSVTSIEEGVIHAVSKDLGNIDIHCDTLVIAAGLKSANDLYEELKQDYSSHIHLLGDARQIGTVLTAVHEGAEIAESL